MKYERKDTFTKPNTPAEVLQLALEKEKSSHDFYSNLIKDSSNSALGPVLEKLKKSEETHIKIIEDMLNHGVAPKPQSNL